MFRLFLRKKLLAGDKQTKAKRPAVPRRNRRINERYNIDHKHLTLMNEQDILLVREISSRGFSTEVSARGAARLTLGDVYDARIRYLGEVYSLQARVAWKQGTSVGFEITKAARDTALFFRRLLRPIEIGSSFLPMRASFLEATTVGKAWYHGDESADLYTWHDPESGGLTAWELSVGDEFVTWRFDSGLSTGHVALPKGAKGAMGGTQDNHGARQSDHHLDQKKKQLAIDVIMAMPHKVRDEILETLLTG